MTTDRTLTLADLAPAFRNDTQAQSALARYNEAVSRGWPARREMAALWDFLAPVDEWDEAVAECADELDWTAED